MALVVRIWKTNNIAHNWRKEKDKIIFEIPIIEACTADVLLLEETNHPTDNYCIKLDNYSHCVAGDTVFAHVPISVIAMWGHFPINHFTPTPDPGVRKTRDKPCDRCNQQTVIEETGICDWCQWDTVLCKYVPKSDPNDGNDGVD